MGHVTPALAIRELLLQRDPAAEFIYVSRKNGPENRLISDIPLEEIEIRGLSRSRPMKNLDLPLVIARAERQCKKIIRQYGPSLVICTGGYVCYPMMKAAHKLGIPSVIHESNSVPGLVTRCVAKYSSAVLLGYPEAKEKIKTRSPIEYVGTPVRQVGHGLSREDARQILGIGKNELYLISFGGSLGAEALNRICMTLMRKYCNGKRSIKHLHGTGIAYYTPLKDANRDILGERLRITPYIHNIQIHMKAADLALTRSGAITIEELKRANTPSVLIPSPNVTDNHQYFNALSREKTGGALLMTEQEALTENGIKRIIKLIEDPEQRKCMRQSLEANDENKNDQRLTELLTDLSNEYSAKK